MKISFYIIGVMEILIGKYRTYLCVSLRDLERRTGISRSTIWDIENGKKSPSMIEMEKIAAALRVKMTDLFESDYK